MSWKPRFILSSLIFAWASLSPANTVSLYTAVFSDQQHFWSAWDSLTPPAKPKPSPLKIGILPVITKNYAEGKPCDSCHRLSANGMQFFLENYFFHKISEMKPKGEVELIAPNMDLVTGKQLPLLKMVDNLQFPLEKWFGGYEQELIFRPREVFTSSKTKAVLNRIGGGLGYSHLLIPTRFEMRVRPTHSENFFGELQYGFILIFWNVALASPEWAISYREVMDHGNLDNSLEKNLDKNLLSWIEDLPGKVRTLRAQEPK